MKENSLKKILRIIVCLAAVLVIGYLRLGFSCNSLNENDAVLYTEIVKIANGINPFPHFTFKWAPLFLTGYYGWILSDLRVLVYFLLPFLRPQIYLTAFFGILVIFSTYRFAVRLYKQKNVGLLAAFLVSIIPIHVSMSWGLSAEIPQTLFLIESYNFLIDYIHKRKSRDFFISGTLLAFSVLSKPISMLMLPSICFLVVINKECIKGNALKFLSLYFILPVLIWLSWAVPSFYRIIGNQAHSFSSFGFNVGSETMKIGLIESHLEFLSKGGIFLLVLSLSHLVWLRRKQDIFLLFSVVTSLLILYSLKDVMTYWYPFIVPFYCIVIARAFFAIRFKVAKALSLIPLIYFVVICIRTDIINLYFDFNSQSGFSMRPDSESMFFPLVQCQKNVSTIKKLKEIIKEGDVIFLSHTFGSYKGLLWDTETHYLPVYRFIKEGRIEFKENWLEEVNQRIKDVVNTKKCSVVLVLQDGGYYYRVYDKGIWQETHQDRILESGGFKKMYEHEYPDKEALYKCSKYYRYCSTEIQWVKNYIFIKEYN